ncbi:MAG: hypothetical protein JXP34_16150 [Planctomycetes bacterium]|nr:hypothetical protein [Planctomycetota bacterium]
MRPSVLLPGRALAAVLLALVTVPFPPPFAVPALGAPAGAGDPADLALAAQIKSWTGPARDFPRGIRLEEDRLIRATPETEGLYVVDVPAGGSSSLGVEWEERRDVDRVVIEYADRRQMPAFGDQDLQLWLKTGAEGAEPEGGATPFEGAWVSVDDTIRITGCRWTHTFAPPEGGILKIRVSVRGAGKIAVRSFEAYGRARWREARVRFRLGVGRPERRDWDGAIEVHNGVLLGLTPLVEGPAAPRIDGSRWTAAGGAGAEPAIEARLLETDAGPESPDRTIVTIRTRVRSFSFLMSDLAEQGIIGPRDFGVVVARGDLEPTEFALRQRVEGKKTIRERVTELPEQSFETALASIPEKKRTKFLVLSPPLARNKFCVRPDGSFFARWDRDLVFRIETADGAGGDRPQGVEAGYLPILLSAWAEGPIRWRATYFTRFIADLFEPAKGDEPTVLLVRLEAENAGAADAEAKARIVLRRGAGGPGMLSLDQGFLLEVGAIRLRADPPAKGSVSLERGSGIAFAASLAPGERASFVVKAPWPGEGADAAAVRAALAAMDFDASRESVRAFWEIIIARGMDVRVPEEPLDRIWRSLLIHQYAWGDRDPKTGYDLANVAAVVYGPVGNESSQMAKALDLWGHADQARRYLEPLWRMKGSNDLRACVADGDGALPGFWSHYVFNTGFILWNAAIHWRLTRDGEWLDQALPTLIEAADWIVRQRRLTLREEGPGTARLEYGFFPACGLEDEAAYRYWTMTNGYMALGVRSVADLLTEIEHPDAKRVAAQADAFRQDLLAGFRESITRAPVVGLRSGYHVPYVPKYLHRRGRSEGHYEAELGALHLVTCGLLEPSDEVVDWILDFHEDVVYMTEAPDHHPIIPLDRIEELWFPLGGFAKTQPYLLHNQIVHLRRDDVKSYLRGLWNCLVAMNYPDVNAFPEHFCWDGAADCKTYEEAMFLQQYRAMFVWEEGDVLWLAKGTPRHWLADGNEIEVRAAPSFFGPVSFSLRSEEGAKRIIARVEGGGGAKARVLRLRHPSERPIRTVTVNGEAWKDVDPARETIALPPVAEAIEVIAEY